MTDISKNQRKITCLDCTFRDGGYYNAWNFQAPLVDNYLHAVSAAGVQVVEIGFRLLPQTEFLGPFAYSTDEYLRTLRLPVNVALAVMINVRDILDYGDGIFAALQLLFRPAATSPVKIVRLAAHGRDVAQTGPIADWLKAQGYQVCLNIMQIGGKPAADITAMANIIAAWGSVDVLYFADSLGNLQPAEVSQIVGALRAGWAGDIGIHTHDNMGYGLMNTLAAIDAGVTWVDGTILGMGRGAGNSRTEHLLIELQRRDLGPYQPEALFSLVMDDFERLRVRYQWGSGLLYYLSASYGIHPTYIQELMGAAQSDVHKLINAFDGLRRIQNPASFNAGELQRALKGALQESGGGTWDATNWARGRDVLVVGPGPSVAEHVTALLDIIRRHNPIVICLNTHSVIPPELVSAYAACHHTRIMMECERYRFLKRPLIIPRASVPERVLPFLEGIEVYDFGMAVKEGEYSTTAQACILPAMLVAPYAFAAAYAGGARRILLAGFDGYGAGDSRHLEMTSVFSLCQAQFPEVPLLAITPTTYPLKQSSLYAPDLFPVPRVGRIASTIRHVSFDKDGVLTDVHRYWAHTCRLRSERMIAEFGLAPGARAALLAGMGIDPESMVVMPGGPVGYKPRADVIAGAVHALQELGIVVTSEQLESLFAAVDVDQQKAKDYAIVLLPGVRDTLQNLRQRGVKISVFSSDRQANLERILEELGLRSFFDAVIGGDSVAHPKPHPEGFLEACRHVGATPGESLYVTDTVEDVAMARDGGAADIMGVLSGLATAAAFRSVGCRCVESLRDWHFDDLFGGTSESGAATGTFAVMPSVRS